MIFLACGAHAGYYSVKLWALRVDLNFRTILKNSKQIVDFICGCYYLSRGRLIIDFCNYLFSGLYLLLAVGVLNYLISIFILTSIKCPFVFKYSALTEVEMLEGSFSDLTILKSEIFYSRPSEVHAQNWIWFVVIISKWFVHIIKNILNECDNCRHFTCRWTTEEFYFEIWTLCPWVILRSNRWIRLYVRECVLRGINIGK